METLTILSLSLVSYKEIHGDHFYSYSALISIHNQPRLRTMNITKSNEKKTVSDKKGQMQTISIENYYWQREWSNVSPPTECWLHNLEQAARITGVYAKSDKIDFKCFNQDGIISSLTGKPLKFVNQFIYLGSHISSTESDVNIRVGKTWSAIDWLTTIQESDSSDEIKLEFLQASVVLVLISVCTILNLTKCMEKKGR